MRTERRKMRVKKGGERRWGEAPNPFGEVKVWEECKPMVHELRIRRLKEMSMFRKEFGGPWVL